MGTCPCPGRNLEEKRLLWKLLDVPSAPGQGGEAVPLRGHQAGQQGPGSAPADPPNPSAVPPRLWPALGQLGAPRRAQQAQPGGRPVQQRGQHAVRRRGGAGERRVPHVAGQEEVCYRYGWGGHGVRGPLPIPSGPGGLFSKVGAGSLLCSVGCRASLLRGAGSPLPVPRGPGVSEVPFLGCMKSLPRVHGVPSLPPQPYSPLTGRCPPAQGGCRQPSLGPARSCGHSAMTVLVLGMHPASSQSLLILFPPQGSTWRGPEPPPAGPSEPLGFPVGCVNFKHWMEASWGGGAARQELPSSSSSSSLLHGCHRVVSCCRWSVPCALPCAVTGAGAALLLNTLFSNKTLASLRLPPAVMPIPGASRLLLGKTALLIRCGSRRALVPRRAGGN